MKSVRIQSDNRTTVCLFKIIHKIYTETLDFGTSVTPNPQADILHRSFSFLSAVCGLRLLLCHLSFALLGVVFMFHDFAWIFVHIEEYSTNRETVSERVSERERDAVRSAYRIPNN